MWFFYLDWNFLHRDSCRTNVIDGTCSASCDCEHDTFMDLFSDFTLISVGAATHRTTMNNNINTVAELDRVFTNLGMEILQYTNPTGTCWTNVLDVKKSPSDHSSISVVLRRFLEPDDISPSIPYRITQVAFFGDITKTLFDRLVAAALGLGSIDHWEHLALIKDAMLGASSLFFLKSSLAGALLLLKITLASRCCKMRSWKR